MTENWNMNPQIPFDYIEVFKADNYFIDPVQF